MADPQDRPDNTPTRARTTAPRATGTTRRHGTDESMLRRHRRTRPAEPSSQPRGPQRKQRRRPCKKKAPANAAKKAGPANAAKKSQRRAPRRTAVKKHRRKDKHQQKRPAKKAAAKTANPARQPISQAPAPPRIGNNGSLPKKPNLLQHSEVNCRRRTGNRCPRTPARRRPVGLKCRWRWRVESSLRALLMGDSSVNGASRVT